MKVYTITRIENITPPHKKPGTSKVINSLGKKNQFENSLKKKISSRKRNFKFPKKLLKSLL